MGRRNKPLIVKHTDHRLDLGPAGHNLFISRDKQLAERSARRLRLGMRVVVALLVTLGALAALLAVWFYLVPFFHREFQVDGASSQESSLSQEEEEPALPVYDDMGLPVYGDEVNLFVINESQPAEADVVPQLEEAEGVQVDARIADAVTLLAAAAREDGLVLTFEEGYVSYGEQERRFEEKVDQLMEEEGLTAVMARVEAKAQVPEAGGERLPDRHVPAAGRLRGRGELREVQDLLLAAEQPGQVRVHLPLPRGEGQRHWLRLRPHGDPLRGQRRRGGHAAAVHVSGGVPRATWPASEGESFSNRGFFRLAPCFFGKAVVN